MLAALEANKRIHKCDSLKGSPSLKALYGTQFWEYAAYKRQSTRYCGEGIRYTDARQDGYKQTHIV